MAIQNSPFFRYRSTNVNQPPNNVSLSSFSLKRNWKVLHWTSIAFDRVRLSANLWIRIYMQHLWAHVHRLAFKVVLMLDLYYCAASGKYAFLLYFVRVNNSFFYASATFFCKTSKTINHQHCPLCSLFRPSKFRWKKKSHVPPACDVNAIILRAKIMFPTCASFAAFCH